jgi:hypothetical protein
MLTSSVPFSLFRHLGQANASPRMLGAAEVPVITYVSWVRVFSTTGHWRLGQMSAGHLHPPGCRPCDPARGLVVLSAMPDGAQFSTAAVEKAAEKLPAVWC